MIPADDSVRAATRTARRVVAIAFAATALLAGALALERAAFHQASDAAVRDIKAALSIADTILLEDERLTMSSQLAVASGDVQWVRRYEQHLPEIDKAITAAAKMAPPGAAERFDAATRVANDRLVEMERRALAHVQAGEMAKARAVFAYPSYAEYKAILSQGSDAFMDEVQQAVDARLVTLTRRSWALVAALLVLASLGFWLLWGRLGRDLVHAETAFSDKQAEVTRLALHDTLTGLPNRRYLQMLLENTISRAERDKTHFALLMIDLDGFKPINDRHGHAAGDAVLIELSRRLQTHVRKGEIAARLGGDEFVVALHHGEHQEAPLRAGQRLIAALSAPITLPQGNVHVSASVGVAIYPEDGTGIDDLLRKADVALYRAKDEARGEVRFFQASMDEDVRSREALAMDLRAALAQSEIVPHFQPLIEMASGRLLGFEVLARWPHATRGMVPPVVFVPIAEDSGLIDALTICVMRAALTAARAWDPALTLAVNIAPKQLENEALIERLLQVLRETGFPPERFEVEITENALISDLDLARRIVLSLKRHGIRVALDDFGTGYSSLAHLSELPFDKLKIDRSFIHTMHERHESVTIVNAIIGLGRSLNLPTTAEGIETLEQAQALTRLGCDVGQGFYYSKPVPAGDVAGIIHRYGGSRAQT